MYMAPRGCNDYAGERRNFFMRLLEYIARCLYKIYGGARVKKIADVRTIIYIDELNVRNLHTSDMQGLFGASLSSRRMFSLFVELILKVSFAVSPLELMCVTNLYRQ